MRCYLASTLALLASCSDSTAASRAAIYYGAPESARWVVAVSYERPSRGTIRLCTGSVIAPDVVLTAKHCVYDDAGGGVWTALEAAQLTVTETDDFTAGARATHGVIEIHTTPGAYTRAGAMAGGDLALLRLDGPFDVSPIAVARTTPPVGTSLMIAGFGFTETDELGVKHSAHAGVSAIGEGVFETEGSSWTCTGDSGGPALDEAAGGLVGVTSYGPSACDTSTSYYTRIDRHLGMIDAVLGVAPAPDAGSASDAGRLEPPATDAGWTPSPVDPGGSGRSGGGCSIAGAPATTALPFLVLLWLTSRRRRGAGLSCGGGGWRWVADRGAGCCSQGASRSLDVERARA